ncbi:MAG: NADH-quinone oxidoreductase subunit L [Candidatus Hecatellales archaeon]|nr:MAG: NADH-quinone oxidoreductase subunit L [Candidatus Hecatellales archaeon]
MLPYAPFLVWVIPLVASALMPLAALNSRTRDIFPVLVGFTTAVFAFSMVPDVAAGPPYPNPQLTWLVIPGLITVNIGVIVDPLSVFMACVVAGIGSLILLYSIGYMAGEEGMTRYWFFMLLFIGSMVGLVVADNFLWLYIFWEMVGLCSYALIGFWYKRPEARKAGFKAFIVTRIGDVFLLTGIILVYLTTGSFAFKDLQGALEAFKVLPYTLSVVPFLMLIGAIGKSAQLPLHVWLPDAMEGPTPVSALIHAATMVKAGVYLMARTHFIYMEAAPEAWLTTLVWVGAVTALLTATMGLTSVDIKRVLAYSTISQIGYMMMGLGLGAGAGFIFLSQFHLMSHAIFKALLFLAAGILVHSFHGMRDMRKMGGLWRDAPVSFYAMVIGVLALGGVPPFNGFWSKDLIFAAAMETGNYAALAFAVVTAAITLAYGLRLIYLTYLGEKRSDEVRKAVIHEPAVMTIPLFILSALCFITGFTAEGFASFLGILGGHSHVVLHIEPLSAALSIIAIIAGALPIYLVYGRKSPPPERFAIGGWGFLQRMLSEGYYFDRFYYAVFVDGLKSAVQGFRKSHPGILNFNMSLILGGFIVLTLLLLTLGGGW